MRIFHLPRVIILVYLFHNRDSHFLSFFLQLIQLLLFLLCHFRPLCLYCIFYFILKFLFQPIDHVHHILNADQRDVVMFRQKFTQIGFATGRRTLNYDSVGSEIVCLVEFYSQFINVVD